LASRIAYDTLNTANRPILQTNMQEECIMDVQKIGAFISDLRKSKNNTQAEIAQLLNVSHQAVSKWERGESLPDIGLLPLMTKLLGVTVDEMLNGERTPVPATVPVAELAAAAVEQPVEKGVDPINPGHPGHASHRLTFDHVSGLAPFLSKDALESMIEQADGDVHWSNVNALAPFIGRTTLEKLAEKLIDGTIEPRMIMEIAPFLGHEALDRLVNHAEVGSLHWDVISGLGPFLSRKTLSRLVHRIADGPMGPENILGLAPFLEQSDLVILIESRGINGLRPEHLAGLAPFLPQALFEKLVLGYKQEPVSE
jgi:transcriptional regulator with XRE-family HTH domain